MNSDRRGAGRVTMRPTKRVLYASPSSLCFSFGFPETRCISGLQRCRRIEGWSHMRLWPSPASFRSAPARLFVSSPASLSWSVPAANRQVSTTANSGRVGSAGRIHRRALGRRVFLFFEKAHVLGHAVERTTLSLRWGLPGRDGRPRLEEGQDLRRESIDDGLGTLHPVERMSRCDEPARRVQQGDARRAPGAL